MATVLVATALSVVTTTATPAPTEASAWRTDPGAIFNQPRYRGKEWKIERAIVAAINHARKGSSIKFSIFSFDRRPVARALVRAKHRGVRVKVLLNDHQFTRAQRILRRALGTSRKHKSWSRMCSHGCRSRGDILHSKFYLFSHTGASRHVAMVGSANLTYNAVHNQYNDLWISNGRKATYRWFNQLFHQMAKDKPSYRQHPPHRTNENWPAPKLAPGQMTTQRAIIRRLTRSPRHGSLLLQAIPWPHPGPHNDPIIYILDQVHCHGARGGTGDRRGRTIVRVSMHAWTGDRGAWIARKLRRLYAAGCHVELMYGMAGAKVRPVLARKTKRGYVPVRSNGFDTDLDGDLDLYSHQKVLMISGHYGTQRKYRLTVTGSSNYAPHGLTGDEILFLIHRHWAYNAYTRNFKYVWRNRSHRVRYQPRNARVELRSSLPLAARSLPRAERLSDGTVLVPQPRAAGPAWEGD